MHSTQRPRRGAWWSLNLKSWGPLFDALDSVDSDQGPDRMRLTDLKWPQDFRLRHPPPIAGASEPNESNDSDEAHESKVLALGPTFDQLHALDSDQGPSRMPPIDIKSWPWGPTFDSSDPLDSDQGPTRMHRINLKSPGLGGGDFRFIRSIRCGPGSESNESNESKVLALGPTLESFASVYAFDSEVPEEPGGA